MSGTSGITTDSTNIRRTEYYEQLYFDKLGNIDKMDKFLKDKLLNPKQ